MKYLIITKTKWDMDNFSSLNTNFKILKECNFKEIKKLNPKIIFFLHWSKKIPENIFMNFLCIQFHSSDLPKFRGGSPIQHQILNGLSKTKITAFKVSNKIDKGEICLKQNLSLHGNANEIFKRMEEICIKMIIKIIKLKKINFEKQKKSLKIFKRRKPSESQINFKKMNNIKLIYNFIRATDAKNYPYAFLKYENILIEFYNAKIKSNKVYAEVKISKK